MILSKFQEMVNILNTLHCVYGERVLLQTSIPKISIVLFLGFRNYFSNFISMSI